MSDNIPPYEIQLEIIKKVTDVKALVRFRSVSKPGKSFIDDPEFIAGYGARPTQPHRLLLRYKDFIDPHEFKYISIIDDDATFPQQQLDFAPNVSDLLKQLKYSKVIGSSCGLWCFHGHKVHDMKPEEMVVIWNPSIAKSVGIVVPRLLNTLPGHVPTIGFGVRPSTYDPTIVVISDKWQVQLFTLSSKIWEKIPSSNLPRDSIRLESMTRVSIDRFIYWVANDENVTNHVWYDIKNLILSFDLITHEFKEIHLPVSIAKLNRGYISISKLNESLVVCVCINEVNDTRVYGTWKMGVEGDVMTSFEKLFTINMPDLSPMTLLGFRKNGEPIMETVDDEDEDEWLAALQVYEPRSGHIKILGFMEKLIHSSFAHTRNHCFLLTTRMVIFSLMIIEGQNGARCGARNGKFWKVTITSMIFGFVELGFMKYYRS